MVSRRHFDNLHVRVVRIGRACYTDPCDGYTRRHFDNLHVRVVRIGMACYTDPCDGYSETF